MIISVNGLPGTGKSSVIARLVERMPVTPCTEDVENFPFVEHADGANPDLAFLNQVDFLMTKMRQTLGMPSSATTVVEVDWVTCHVHWSTTLERTNRVSRDHARSLQQVYVAGVAAGVPKPRRAYYLTAPIDVLVARIDARNRPWEHSYRELLLDLENLDLPALERELACPLRVLDATRSIDDLSAAIADDLVTLL
jgi:deoxyadenosine/deoxycytidine kinase